MSRLHEVLAARQTKAELLRKRIKAMRRCLITQEDVDYARRHGLFYKQLFAGAPIPRLPEVRTWLKERPSESVGVTRSPRKRIAWAVHHFLEGRHEHGKTERL